ncbi:unnamed protein product [Rhodiola kirilowii]
MKGFLCSWVVSAVVCSMFFTPFVYKFKSTIYSQSLFGSVCCSSKDDQQLQKQFKAMNPSDAGCASVLKSILCTVCSFAT